MINFILGRVVGAIITMLAIDWYIAYKTKGDYFDEIL
jgi:vancomycin permeability regulator SanA